MGLRQGCVMSPILFAIFLADLEPFLKTFGQGAKLLDIFVYMTIIGKALSLIAGKSTLYVPP